MRKDNNFTVWGRELGRGFDGKWFIVAVEELWCWCGEEGGGGLRSWAIFWKASLSRESRSSALKSQSSTSMDAVAVLCFLSVSQINQIPLKIQNPLCFLSLETWKWKLFFRFWPGSFVCIQNSNVQIFFFKYTSLNTFF